MFKNHDSGILTLSLFTTCTHVFCLARHYFTNARQMHWSYEGKYTIAMCMLYVQTTVYNVHKAHLFFTQILCLSKYNWLSVCAMYRLYIGNTYVAYCVCSVYNVYSVFAIHYKYVVEVLGKTIRRTMMIDHSFERKFYEACFRLC